MGRRASGGAAVRVRGAIAGAPQTSNAEVPEFTPMGRAMAPRRGVPRTFGAGCRLRRLAANVASERRTISAEADARFAERRDRRAIADAPQTHDAEVAEFTMIGRATAPQRGVPRTFGAGCRLRRLAAKVALERRTISAEDGAVGRPRPTRSRRPEHCDGERRQGVQAAQPAPGGRPQRAAVKGVAERRDRRRAARWMTTALDTAAAL